jgi:DNA-binding response OmpR family regulator
VRFLHIEVVTASDGLGALASVADVQPNLMLLDILPPHVDGYEVCDAIRHHQDKHDLAILLLSGKDSVVDRLRDWLAGSTDYRSKLFDPAELVWPVKHYLYMPSCCAQHVTDAETLEATLVTEQLVDASIMRYCAVACPSRAGTTGSRGTTGACSSHDTRCRVPRSTRR